MRRRSADRGLAAMTVALAAMSLAWPAHVLVAAAATTTTSTTSPGDTATSTTAPLPTGPDFKIATTIPPSAQLSGLKCGGAGGQWTIDLAGSFSEAGITIQESGTITVTLDDSKSPPSGPASGHFHTGFVGLDIEASVDSSLTATAVFDARGLTFNGVSNGTVKVTGLPIPLPGGGAASSIVNQVIPVESGVFCPGSQAVASTTTSSTTSSTTSTTTAASGPRRIGPKVTGTPGVALRSDPPGVPPGGQLVASGSGCDPNSSVSIDVGNGVAGTGTADATGKFLVALHNLSLEVGPHTLAMTCGTRTAAIPIAVSVQAAATPPGGSLLVVISFILLAVFVAYRMLLPGSRRRRPASSRPSKS